MENRKSVFDIADIPPSLCIGCKYCKRIDADPDWKFYGCFKSPYNGKWIAEIKECPNK